MSIEFFNEDCVLGMKRYPDKYFDLAIVDPVYGDVTQGGYMKNLDSTSKLARPRKYHLSLWGQAKTGKEYFNELFRCSKNQIIWGGNYFTDNLPPSQCWICWDKKRTGGFADFELAFTSFNCASRFFRYTWNGMIQEDMSNKESRIHPTQKPVALYKWLLNKFAKSGDLILDTHVGSGSSLIACYQLQFNCVGFEIDDVYYQLANERIKEETKQINIFEMLTKEKT